MEMKVTLAIFIGIFFVNYVFCAKVGTNPRRKVALSKRNVTAITIPVNNTSTISDPATETSTENSTSISVDAISNPKNRASLRQLEITEGCDLFKPVVCVDCYSYYNCLGKEDNQCPGETPFCVTSPLGDYCSASAPPKGCIFSSEASITCTGEGLFPDPFNCRIYHQCLAYDQDSYPESCPEGYVYKSTTEQCIRSARPIDCQTLKCDNTKLFSRFGMNTMYYGYCYQPLEDPLPGDTLRVDIYKCTEGSKFDGNTCVYTCPREGRFPDTSNKNRYFDCYRSIAGPLTYEIKICLTGNFNPDKSRCDLNSI